MRLVAGLLLALAAACGARAQDATPRSSPPLRDPDFGVESRGAMLERRVQMYQWRETGAGSTSRYQKTWSATAIDSTRFVQPQGHDNPSGLPIEAARWKAESFTLDGQPLDATIQVDVGDWRALRPDPAHVPPNLAASFQPDGAGLASSADPRDRQIGDLRLRWRERLAKPIVQPIALVDGRWIADWASEAPAPVAPGDAKLQRPPLRLYVYSAAIATIFVLLAFVLLLRRRGTNQFQPSNRTRNDREL